MVLLRILSGMKKTTCCFLLMTVTMMIIGTFSAINVVAFIPSINKYHCGRGSNNNNNNNDNIHDDVTKTTTKSIRLSTNNNKYNKWPLQNSASNTETSTTSSTISDSTEIAIEQLKKVLEKEYITFFNPMEREYYADNVIFDDPLNDINGVDNYQKNVDMLSGRTLLGSLLFQDAGINLHSVTGGVYNKENNTITEIITRWTLRMTFKILPWKPSPRFSGISKYTVIPGGSKGVQIIKQVDYWDTINLITGNEYQSVDKSIAINHFIDQLKPGNFVAPSAGPELPYETLRIGNGGYEVRRYPAYTAVQMIYTRRDEAFSAMGDFTQGMNPLAPAIIDVQKDDIKTMLWPLNYALPGQDVSVSDAIMEKAKNSDTFNIITIPERVIAIQRFTGAIVEPVVRKVDTELREMLQRDGLIIDNDYDDNNNGNLMFAQYDAVFSMGQRRSEVHIPLQDGGHPW